MKNNKKYKKNDLEKLIIIEKLSYREIGRLYGVSDTYIKKVSKKLGIELKKRTVHPENWKPHNKGKGKNFLCKNCNNQILSISNKPVYCCKKCEIEYKTNEYYEYYLKNQNKFCNTTNSMKFIKKHILKEQNYCCQICGIKNQWNNKLIVFILDHINGDASNNKRENLRLVCPNCDSQLDTYKSKNKNSARKERYLLNYKNKK
jgi:hypothetical protein